MDLVEWKGDILAVGVTEKDMAKDENCKFENSILRKLDTHLGGLLAEASSEEDFNGKAGKSMVSRLPGLGSKRIGLIGLGQCTPSSSATIAYRGLGEAVAAAAKAAQACNVAIALASSGGLLADSKLNIAWAIASGMSLMLPEIQIDILVIVGWNFFYVKVLVWFIVTGTVLGGFDDNRFKSVSKKHLLKSVDILGLGIGPELENKLKYAGDVCSGIIFAKELVNAPANVLTPGSLQFSFFLL